jgi:hypothetical protein
MRSIAGRYRTTRSVASKEFIPPWRDSERRSNSNHPLAFIGVHSRFVVVVLCAFVSLWLRTEADLPLLKVIADGLILN